MKPLRWLTAAVWAMGGLFFGVGTILFGAQHFESPGGKVALLVGLIVVGCAYFLHRLTWVLLAKLGEATA